MIALIAAVAAAIAPAPTPIDKLAEVVAPERATPRIAAATIGHSAEGRPIRARGINGLSAGPLILVFGCIHGDECAGIRAAARAWRGCPPYGSGLITVANLNPDGRVHGTRLNANGVDLNRNFAYDWRPIGAPGDPEHSGSAPLSEPESRIARRLIRALRPDVTIWFHQQAEPLVRAWGPSIPAARTYARLAGERFVAMPWMAGTAPNWQNHAFPGTASFVVELPADGPVDANAHGRAIFDLAGEMMGVRTLSGRG